ncbi:MAG: hypothetical protein LC624_05710 [Halobacteriales archaeon]|nr:hypothetical protein [Halobacteriales archaeon]
MRLPFALAALALLASAFAPAASAYTCTQPAPGVRACDVNDDGVPDVYFITNPSLGTIILVAYKDPAITSVGAAYVLYPFGVHTGGVSVGCYDPNGDLNCDQASVAYGSSDLGYVEVDKFDNRLSVCRYGGVFGFGCTPL